jgi:uncharacterized Zn finger protein
LRPLQCPVCGKEKIEPVLQKVHVQAQYEGFRGDIGGLRTYRCTELGHIFFVRTTDLETPLEGDDARTAAS